MNYSIISFVVFLLAVDSTFSLECYECRNYRECDNPKPTTCSLDDFCVKLTKARRMESRYACGVNSSYFIEEVYNCKKYPDNCTLCHENLCNEPDKKITHNLRKCYECYNDLSMPNDNTSTFSDLGSCWIKNEKKVRCYPNEQCVVASSNFDLRRYHGCVKDMKNFCKQHNFENCTFCDKDFCNEVNYKPKYRTCYRCYSGKTSHKKFKNFKNCSHPEEVKCGHGLQCARATDKLGERSYYDCGPINNKTDEFCKKYGFDDCELCDDDWSCNNPNKAKKNCYNCIFSDPNSKTVVTQFPKNLPNCSQPLTSLCTFGECLTLTHKKNGKLITAIHTCALRIKYLENCFKKGVDCQYCNYDLCNEVAKATAIASQRRTSSAEVLKNNTISLLNLLFIFIIIRAAL